MEGVVLVFWIRLMKKLAVRLGFIKLGIPKVTAPKAISVAGAILG